MSCAIGDLRLLTTQILTDAQIPRWNAPLDSPARHGQLVGPSPIGARPPPVFSQDSLQWNR
jgi:hypothetical protein